MKTIAGSASWTAAKGAFDSIETSRKRAGLGCEESLLQRGCSAQAADKISQGQGPYSAFAGYAKATLTDRLTIGSSLATDQLKHVHAPCR